MKGYLHHSYAQSLAAFGTPVELDACGAWILRRRVPDSSYYDAMGCYPRFMCRDWSQLDHDLEHLEGQLVSLSIVTDPFGHYDLPALRQSFDVVTAFKTHFVVDLRLPMDTIASKHKRRFARNALRTVEVEICSDPNLVLGEWVDLYADIVKRHRVTGVRAFSKSAFEVQLSIPGTVLFRAVHEGETVGFHWYFHQGDVVYGHLAALAPESYDCHAPYALQWTAIEHFRGKSRWLDLGAGAGVENDGTEGLKLFKRGWSTATRTAYFCGRILDQRRYNEMVHKTTIDGTSYFPAYRAGEFV